MTPTTPEARLLVVEDEPNILEPLSASLRLAGFEVATATAGLRPSRPCSATGLTVGGDDHVTKPFSLEEVIADLELDEKSHEVWRAGQRAAPPTPSWWRC